MKALFENTGPVLALQRYLRGQRTLKKERHPQYLRRVMMGLRRRGRRLLPR